MSEEAHFISNPMVWYAATMAIFFAGAFRYGRKPIVGALDAEIAKIRAELDEAKKLRAEAAETLKEYRVRQKTALAEAESIVKQAKKDAEMLRSNAAAEMKAALERHEQKAVDRIRLAEEEALAEVRAAVIDEAVAVARKTLSAKLDPATALALADQSIAEAPKLAPGETKAA